MRLLGGLLLGALFLSAGCATGRITAETYRDSDYDFIYVAPPAAFPQGRPDFEAFVNSWTPFTER